ncbi:DUF3426 domain-containing protein [Cupriavidus sp. 30B13]|uniref:DUF3426 domain-containing protein n=1 Tax=Cupriavidus sp. 30B13 TaxID=3384241 RepID=UPI003B915ACF
MAAAKLVTRCPACRTAFRLVADQLRLRQGLVRCGQCDTVFDAREHLIELPAPEAAPAAEPQATQETSAHTTPARPHHRAARTPHEKTFDDTHDAVQDGAHEETREETHEAAHARAPRAPRKRAHAEAHPATHAAADAAATQPAQAGAGHGDAPPAPAFAPPFDPGYDVPALDAPTIMLYQTQAEADQAVQAAEAARQQEREAGGTVAGVEDDEPSAVFVPGVIEQEPETAAAREDGVAPAQTGSAAETDAGSVAEPPREPEAAAAIETTEPAATAADATAEAAPASAATSWPTLDPRTLSDDLPPFAPAVRAAPEEAAAAPADNAHEAQAEPTAAHAATPLPPPPRPQAGIDDATHTAGIEEHAEEHAADAPAPAARESGPASHAAPAEPAAVPSASGYLRAEAQDDFPEIPAAVAREQAGRQWAGQGTPDAPVFAPDFLRHARARDPGPARRKRRLQKLAIAALAVAALAQVTFLARSQLSGQFPLLRPAFEALCAPLGCEVAPWRDIDALRIESSQLQKQDEESDAYLLAVTMRNQSRATVALPAIELVMTDLQDQLLLRKVLQPADYLEPAQKAFATLGLRAGTELPVRVRFRTQQAAANYRVLIFYP